MLIIEPEDICSVLNMYVNDNVYNHDGKYYFGNEKKGISLLVNQDTENTWDIICDEIKIGEIELNDKWIKYIAWNASADDFLTGNFKIRAESFIGCRMGNFFTSCTNYGEYGWNI